MDNLTDWLQKWKLCKYEDKLRAQGIETPQDFKYIKSKQQFDKFAIKLGDDIPYMHILKLEDAWLSIVPITQQQSNTQIHFLGEDERNIMDKLYKRYTDSSEDVNTVQKATNEFAESVVQSKKVINDEFDKIISRINTKRNELLNKIESMNSNNAKILNEKLQLLTNVNKLCLKNKQFFETIATDTNISPKQKLKQLNTLLSLNIIVDDDTKIENDNYDNYKIIGNECIVPEKISVETNWQSFDVFMNSFLSINCKNITSDWKMKKNYTEQIEQKGTIDPAQKFDKDFSAEHYQFSEGNRCATLKSGSWPSVKVLPTISNKNNTVIFSMSQSSGYGYYGIGNDQTKANGFAGYANNKGWVIRNHTSGFWTNGQERCYLTPKHGNVQNKKITLSFDFSTKKLTSTVDNKRHISPVLNVDVSKNVYFIMSGNGDIEIKLLE